MWLNKVVSTATSKISKAQEGLSQVLQDIDHTMEESLMKAGGGEPGQEDGDTNGEPSSGELVYRTLLGQFQLDQIKVTKEYQKVFAEKEAELRRIVELYEQKTGEKLEQDGGGGEGEGEDRLKAYQSMDAEQLRAQVEVLLDSVKSWEERVRELLEGKTEILAEVERNKMQVRRVEQRMGDLIDRVKLQQTELERYIQMTQELETKRRTDAQTIEGMLQDYNNLVGETQAQEEAQAKRIRELENLRDELVMQKAAYERNILQLIDTQAELGRRKKEEQEGGGGGGGDAGATIEALQKKLAEKEEEIRRIASSSSAGSSSNNNNMGSQLLQSPGGGGVPSSVSLDPEASAKLELAQVENDRLKKDLERARKGLEQAQKAGEKLAKEVGELKSKRSTDENAEVSALRQEVTELQGKLEAAYKEAKAQAATLQDKLYKQEKELEAARATHATGSQQAEEAQKKALEAKEAALQEAIDGHRKALAAMEKSMKDKEAEWSKEREALAGEQGKALNDAIHKAEASLASQRSEHESALSSLKSAHEAALSSLRASLQGEQAKAVQEAKEEASREKDKALEAMRVSTEEQVKAAVDAEKSAASVEAVSKAAMAEKDKAEALAALQAELVNKIAAAEKDRDDAKAALSKVEAVWKAKQDAAMDAQAKEMQADKARALEDLRRSLQALVDEANKDKAEALELYSQESRKRKLIHNKLLELQGNIRVLCRVRPVLPMEVSAGEGTVVTEFPSPEDIIVHKDATSRSRFEFDRVFSPTTMQAEVFEGVKPLITSFLDGYNVCIFAYGQTGSGKTFTMEGPPDDRGVNFRALEELFRLRDDKAADYSYTLQLSSLEVYNETIRDLLGVRDPREGLPKLDIKLLADGEYDVPGLTLVEVHSMEEVVSYMNQGKQNRAVGAHDMNEHSSRSHSILSIRVRGENLHDRTTTTAKLHLIDLAGSERLSKTDATGERLKEAQNINKSLSALGDVINALSSKTKGHVPYRNSKLTFLLQDSLGGNSKVLMFVNISPAAYNAGETICSLNFAARCRNVQLGSAKKGITDGEVVRLRETVEQLKEELANTKGGKTISPGKTLRSTGSSSSLTGGGGGK